MALLAAVALTSSVGTPAAAGPRRQLSPIGSSGDFYFSGRSIQDLKYASVLRQRYDFSCGSAALATLLRFHYGFSIDEASVFRGMWATGDHAQIQKLGFSLLDMKRFLAGHELKADGFKIGVSELAKAELPGIALISTKGYKHFVVVKGLANGNLLIGDPARGLRVESTDQFSKSWNGIYFVIDPAAKRGGFNIGGQWASAARAPLGNRFSAPLSIQVLALTAPSYGDF